MEASAYKLTYRVQERPGRLVLGIMLYLLTFGIWGRISVALSDLVQPYSSIGGKLIALIGLIGLFGVTWFFLKLTRTASTVVLDEDGFTIIKHSTLNVLPKEETLYSWADFSYQAGGYNDRRYKSYTLSIFFKDGSSCDFLTGISPMQIDIINKMHQDIEQRVSAFRTMHPDATP